MVPLGKKQARNQVNHNIYALSMLQLVYVKNYLSLKLFFSHRFICPALTSSFILHIVFLQTDTLTLHKVVEKLDKPKSGRIR